MSTKSRLLARLEAQNGQAVSGQKLAEELGVSRSAIWKNVKELQKDGYQIHGTTNKGYCFSSQNDLLSAEGITHHLQAEGVTLPVVVLQHVGSTNVVAKQFALKEHAGNMVIVAEQQTHGKGRQGRSFFSPKHCGIYMSLLITEHFYFESLPLITAAAAVAVWRAIYRTTGIATQIKWVNDLYLNGNKIAGILTEASTNVENHEVHYVIVGIGLNVCTNTADFPSEIRQSVSSLYPNGGQTIGRNRLAAAIITELLAMVHTLPNKAFLHDYRAHSNLIGRTVYAQIANTTTLVTVLAIDDNAALIVQMEDGTQRTLNAGEIHFGGLHNAT